MAKTYTRDYEAEQKALADALKSQSEGGANVGISTSTKDVATLPDATRKLIQEQVNMRVYGTGAPTFESATTATPATTPTATPTETPTTETTSVERPVYKTYYDPLTDTTYSADEYLNNLEKPSEQDIRDQVLAQYQAIIDATDSIYQSEVSRLTTEGQERLAQTSSIAVSAGLAGSPFQQTMETGTESYNTQVLQARQAERAAEIASIMATAEGRATEQYESTMNTYQEERAFYTSERDKEVAQAEAKTEAAKDKALSTISNFATGGYSLDELDSESYQALLADAGISDFEAKAIWASQTPSANATYSIQNGMLVGTYFDPVTQKPVVSVTSLPEELQASTSTNLESTMINGAMYFYDPENPTYDANGNVVLSRGVTTTGETLQETEEIGAPTIQKFGEDDYRQWNPTTGGWEQVASTSTTSTKVTEEYLQSLDAQRNNIKDLMEHPGLSVATGTSWLGRFRSLATAGAIDEFTAKVKQLVSQETLNELATAKERGITFGALSEQEMQTVREAATTLADWLVEKEDGTSYFNTSEENVLRELNKLGQEVENAYQRGLVEWQQSTGYDDIDQFLDSFSDDLSKSVNGSTDISSIVSSFRGNVVGDVQPSATLASVNLGDNTVQVNSSIANRLLKADAEYYADTGQHLPISQSYRTQETQRELYDRLSKRGSRVAEPGYSFHELGMAIDVHSDWERAEPYLEKYGFANNLADDRGHFSIGEFGTSLAYNQ